MIHSNLNKIYQPVRAAVAMLAIIFVLISCNGWTEVESITLNQPNPSESNPENYAKYLERLRAYKQSEHYSVYAWFDNSQKEPYSRAHHISDLPDSIDVVVMMHPDDLADFELQEMEALRKNKGTKVVYSISYDAIRNAYLQMVKDSTEQNAAYQAPDLDVYINAMVQLELHPAVNYNYDGIIAGYKGTGVVNKTSAEKDAYLKSVETFINAITAWKTANGNKTLDFEGYPQNLVDKTFLTLCKHIILNTLEATNVDALSFAALQALEEGVPSTAFIVAAPSISIDAADKTTGYYNNGERAVTESAYWVTEPAATYTKAGLGIYNIRNDYYDPASTYQHTVKAIHIMNPAHIR
ncbi:MAG: glycoside hydrolase family 18 [Mediterranea sp.]|jgi:hypothetical protein|nr:glycoside hydrolase family 18 [Mediterranea sp.]